MKAVVTRLRLLPGIAPRTVLDAALPSLWAVLTLAALWARPLAPVDETRYATVAWEMWLGADWLVPHLNGAPYPDKPPLLFWLVNLVWSIVGPSDWAARLVGAAATLLDLYLLRRLQRLLWPATQSPARLPATSSRPLAPWIFYGCFLVAAWSTTLTFDLLLTACVLVALIGLVGSTRNGRPVDWLLYALGVGFGILAKGPVILLHVLPVALLAPWWLGAEPGGGWLRWYARLALALLGGAALALCWALPAGRVGGTAYADALFRAQTMGRMVHAFQHERPWWWYLPLLPAILLPWSLWLPLWRAAPALARQAGVGERFCVAWLVPGLVGFSAISGKQAHYLIPLLPAFALLAARALQVDVAGAASRVARVIVVAPLVGVGLVIALRPILSGLPGLPSWWAELSPPWGIALAVLTIAWIPRLRSPHPHARVAALGILAMVLLHAGPVRHVASPAYDAGPLAREIALLRASGVLVAYPGKYRGDFQFAGRLREPLDQLWPGTEVAWAREHPDAVLVLEFRSIDDAQRAAAILAVPYRNRVTGLWPARALVDRPELARNAVSAPPLPAAPPH